MFRLLALALLVAVAAAAPAEIKKDPIDYDHDGVALQGWLVYDDSFSGQRPGVLVVHQWTGITDYEMMRAGMLAELGYVAFVADIYGKGVSPVPRSEAGQWAGKFRSDRPLFRARVGRALDVMKENKLVDSERTAAIGYCFGGGAVLELARSGAEVSGVVSFHGGLNTPTPEDAKNIKGKVLVLHGADDPVDPLTDVVALVEEMRAGGVDYHIVLYGDAVHSFTQPSAGSDKSRGSAYDEKADKRSWEHMKQFFEELFGKF
jgi:dienelactone hydrolase